MTDQFSLFNPLAAAAFHAWCGDIDNLFERYGKTVDDWSQSDWDTLPSSSLMALRVRMEQAALHAHVPQASQSPQARRL